MNFYLLIDAIHKLDIGSNYLVINGQANGTLKRWNGSSWVLAQSIQVFDGTNFTNKPLKRWTGDSWEIVSVI